MHGCALDIFQLQNFSLTLISIWFWRLRCSIIAWISFALAWKSLCPLLCSWPIPTNALNILLCHLPHTLPTFQSNSWLLVSLNTLPQSPWPNWINLAMEFVIPHVKAKLHYRCYMTCVQAAGTLGGFRYSWFLQRLPTSMVFGSHSGKTGDSWTLPSFSSGRSCMLVLSFSLTSTG